MAVLLLLAGSVWGVRETMESRRAAANLAEIEQMREQYKSPRYTRKCRPTNGKQFRKEYREKYKKLTFEQQQKLTR